MKDQKFAFCIVKGHILYTYALGIMQDGTFAFCILKGHILCTGHYAG